MDEHDPHAGCTERTCAHVMETAAARRADPLPDVPVHRSRKRTGQWCRGKVGVPHVWEIVRHHAYVGPPFAGRSCHLVAGGRITYSWWACYHVKRCETCGKLAPLPTDLCPDRGPA